MNRQYKMIKTRYDADIREPIKHDRKLAFTCVGASVGAGVGEGVGACGHESAGDPLVTFSSQQVLRVTSAYFRLGGLTHSYLCGCLGRPFGRPVGRCRCGGRRGA